MIEKELLIDVLQRIVERLIKIEVELDKIFCVLDEFPR